MNENLTKNITAKRELFEAKSKERDAILAKSDIAADDITAAKAINVELESLAGEIKSLGELHETASKHESFLNDPVFSIKTGVSVMGAPQGGSGTVVVERGEEKTDIFSEGIALSEKQLKTVRDPGYKRAFESYVRRKGDFTLMDNIERKTLQEGVDDQGGYLVPEDMLSRIIDRKPAPTRLNGRVTSIPTTRDAISIPNVQYAADDTYTTGIRATLTGEVPSSSTVHRVTDPVFGQTRIEIGTWMLSMPLTNDMIEDAMFPILPWCSGKFAETIALLYDNQILNGTGVGVNPHGILKNPGGTNEPDVVLSATANNIDADQLRGLPFDLPEQYVDNAAWVMNRANCGKYVAQLKDSENRYLFHEGATYPGLVQRAPDTLGGYPIVYSAFAPNRGDGAFPIVFGDFSGYYLANRVGLSIRILDQVAAQDNQVIMLGRLRFGGKVAEPFKLVVGKSDNA